MKINIKRTKSVMKSRRRNMYESMYLTTAYKQVFESESGAKPDDKNDPNEWKYNVKTPHAPERSDK